MPATINPAYAAFFEKFVLCSITILKSIQKIAPPIHESRAPNPCNELINSLKPEKVPVNIAAAEEKIPVITASFLKLLFTLSCFKTLPIYTIKRIEKIEEIISPTLKNIPPGWCPKILMDFFHII